MTLELKAQIRQLPTPQLNQTRKNRQIPVELYGHDQGNQHLIVESADLEKIYQQAGESSLVDVVAGEGKPVKAIIREVQYHPVTGQIIHADFQAVKMDEELETKVTLIFEGESKAIKELGGTLIKSLEELEIKCLPADLIHDYVVNIDVLNTFDDVIRVKDLKISSKIKIMNDPETVVALATPVHVEKEPEPTIEAAPEPELVGKEKKEGEEEEPAKPEKKEKK